MSLPPELPASHSKALPKPSHTGHRQRLKERFLSTQGVGFADYELLELLLFYAIPQKDVKPLAKTLIQQFGSFSGVIQASPALLMDVKDLKQNSVTLFKMIQLCCERVLIHPLTEKPLLSSFEQLEKYCSMRMSHLIHEQFHVLFLDSKNRLILDEIQQKGTIDQAPVFPREIIKRCLELGSCHIILAHNHPSGDPTPSKADIELTNKITQAAQTMDIDVHDHIIIGRKKMISFRKLGLLS
jgi:DNA repair protein RadC